MVRVRKAAEAGRHSSHCYNLRHGLSAQNLSPKGVEQLMLERRAVDAVVWGMPIVSLDAMRQAYFRDGKAKYGDIVWWPKGNAWKNQSLTPIQASATSTCSST
jgi:hypothetical protein